MKSVLILLFFPLSNVIAAEGVICKGVDCNPIEIHASQNYGNGLLNLRNEQKSKLKGASQHTQNENFPFAGNANQTESGEDIKLHEFRVGTCLIHPKESKTYYKILEKDDKSGKVRYVVENENHNYMLRGNVVFWKSPESNALKKLKRFPCNRTPNLYDDHYLENCTKTNKVGDLYCNPKSKI